MTKPARFGKTETNHDHKALAVTAAVLVLAELTAVHFGYVISATSLGRAIVSLVLIWVLVQKADKTAHFSLILMGLTAMAFPILVSPGVSVFLMLPVGFLGIENLWQLMYLGGAALVVVGTNCCGIHILKSALLVAPTLPVGVEHKSRRLRPERLQIGRRIVHRCTDSLIALPMIVKEFRSQVRKTPTVRTIDGWTWLESKHGSVLDVARHCNRDDLPGIRHWITSG